MRWAMTLAAAVCAVGVGACGGGEEREALDDALGYLPVDAPLVLAVPTDLRDSQIRALDKRLLLETGTTVEQELRKLVEEDPMELRSPREDDGPARRLSFDRDVKPLLGNELVAGLPSVPRDAGDFDFVAALRTRDGDRLRALVQEMRAAKPAGSLAGARLYEMEDVSLAVEGDTLVWASSMKVLKRAVSRRDRPDRLTEARFESAGSGLEQDALVRGYGSLRPLLRHEPLKDFLAVRWVAALRSFGLSVFLERNELVLDGALNTESAKLTDTDLPLTTRSGSPPVAEGSITPGREPDTIASASVDQSRTTVFLWRAAKVVLSRSRFVRDVREVERDLGIDFEREFLEQFNGPSTSLVEPEGRFAARSTVRDPERMARLLPRLAPRLGRLVQDLDPLRKQGLTLLLLLAPDAPVATNRLDAVRVRVTRLRGDGQLYRLSNLRPGSELRGGAAAELPDKIVFGLVDGTFVVASDAHAARKIARVTVKPVKGVEGASVIRGGPGLYDTGEFLDLSVEGFVGSLTASRERLRTTTRIKLRPSWLPRKDR